MKSKTVYVRLYGKVVDANLLQTTGMPQEQLGTLDVVYANIPGHKIDLISR